MTREPKDRVVRTSDVVWIGAGALVVVVLIVALSFVFAGFENGAELQKGLLVALGLGVAAPGAYIALRRQQTIEREAIASSERDYRERYREAAAQIGHENRSVALAGLYALADLADAWTTGRQQCIDLICGYARFTSPRRPSDLDADLMWDEEPERVFSPQQTQLHLAILRIVSDRLTAPSETERPRWAGCTFDFTGVHFGLEDVSLPSLHLTEGTVVTLDKADFTDFRLWINDVRFDGGTLNIRDICLTRSIVALKSAKPMFAPNDQSAAIRHPDTRKADKFHLSVSGVWLPKDEGDPSSLSISGDLTGGRLLFSFMNQVQDGRLRIENTGTGPVFVERLGVKSSSFSTSGEVDVEPPIEHESGSEESGSVEGSGSP